MDIQTALGNFINEGLIAGKSQSTLKGYQFAINNLLKYNTQQFLPQDILSLDKKVLTDYFVYGIKIRRWGQYTRWTMYKNICAFLNWCVRRNLIRVNPLNEMQKPKMPQQLPKSLNEKEARLLLLTVSSLPTKYAFYTFRNKALISFFLFTGIRKNELINLRTSDVDLVNGYIQIECGKGGKRREIPIEQKILKPILEEYCSYKDRLYRTSEWFFNGIFAGRGVNDNKIAISTVDRLFWRLSKILNKRVYAHKLRHTFSTMLLDKGGDLFTLQQLLGHSNIRTTTIYLSSSRAKKTEAISKLGLLHL